MSGKVYIAHGYSGCAGPARARRISAVALALWPARNFWHRAKRGKPERASAGQAALAEARAEGEE